MPSPHAQTCAQCLKKPPAFDATLAALRYAFPADTLIRQLKFGARLPIATLLAEQLLHAVRHRASGIDAIVAMPLHDTRLAERGFNQAMEIIRPIRRRLGRPVLLEGIHRTRATPAQASLPADKRRANLRGAFACSLNLASKRLAVVDDVMTTGASLDELAGTLKKAGASHVENWVVARTWPD